MPSIDLERKNKESESCDRNNRKTSRAVLFATILILLLFAIGSLVNFFGQSLLTSIGIPGAKTKPVILFLEDKASRRTLTMRIPKSYLIYKQNWRGGRQNHILITSRLPDMMPRPSTFQIEVKPDSVQYQEALEKLKNGVLIHLSGNLLVSNYEENRFESLKKRAKLISTDVHGLMHFRRQICSEQPNDPKTILDPKPNPCVYVGNDEFISPLIQTEVNVRLVCTPVDQNPLGGCQAHVRYRDRPLKFTFRRTELHRWKEFLIKVSELLDSFVISDSSVK